jgi:hypothetical protein
MNGLEDVTAEAAARWSAAMDYPVELGEGGVPVELALRIPRPDGSDAPGSTTVTRDLIRINQRTRGAQLGRTLVHEMGHALGMVSEYARGGVIDAEALAEVCELYPCGRITPEGEAP